MIQFLIDEDVTPRLRDVAIARGYNAYHVQYLDWKGRKDFEIRRRMLDKDLTLVTGNWRDFRPMLQREEIHPGAILLPDVPRAAQIRLFETTLDYIQAATPPNDMVNRILIVDEGGQVEDFEIPDVSADGVIWRLHSDNYCRAIDLHPTPRIVRSGRYPHRL